MAPRLTRDLRARIAADPYAESLGIEMLALRPGYSRMRLVPAPSMVNFHGMVHGGVIFALADAAFAAASNAHGDSSLMPPRRVARWSPKPARTGWAVARDSTP